MSIPAALTHIHNLKELNELGRDLKKSDKIYFTTKDEVIEYCVYNNHLYTLNSHNNSFIFAFLNLSKKAKNLLTEKYYGYKSGAGDWPICKNNDFQALERLIREIYKRLGDNSTLDPKDFILNRFEILDL